MDIKKLNEDIKALLEGDVVSFVDYKKQKIADRRKQRNAEFMDKFDAELQKDMDEFNKKNLLVNIDKVKVLWAEDPIDKPYFDYDEEYSYEHFQEELWVLDYFNQIKENYAKCEFELYLSANNGETQTFKMRVTIGGGKEECDIYQYLEMRLHDSERNVMIKNDPVPYNENYYKSLVKEYGIVKPEPEQPKNLAPAKDYSNNETKSGEDIEVGDILYSSWGYEQTNVYFYKVIDRKNKTIKLAQLGQARLDEQNMSAKVVPTNDIVPDADVDGKKFRISKYGICRVDGHSLSYWNGKPKYASYYA